MAAAMQVLWVLECADAYSQGVRDTAIVVLAVLAVVAVIGAAVWWRGR